MCGATSIARHSRVNSSITTSIRNARPSSVRSATKSYPFFELQRVLVEKGSGPACVPFWVERDFPWAASDPVPSSQQA